MLSDSFKDMRSIRHDPNSCLCYYANQVGGSDVVDIPIYRGVRYQRGYGIGSVFRSLFRWATPMFKNLAYTAGRYALNSGGRVLDDLEKGENLQTATKKQLQRALNDITSGQAGRGRLYGKRKWHRAFNTVGERLVNTSLQAIKKKRKQIRRRYRKKKTKKKKQKKKSIRRKPSRKKPQKFPKDIF